MATRVYPPPSEELGRYASELLAGLLVRFPLKRSPVLEWAPYRVTAGMAIYDPPGIRLSRLVLDDLQKVHDTLVHEFAHLLALERAGRAGRGHGPAWKLAMSDLGAEAKVHHDFGVRRNTSRSEVRYTCDKCGTHLRRKRRLPRNRKYLHVGCGGVVRFAGRYSANDAEGEA